jgi:hypothetical protein
MALQKCHECKNLFTIEADKCPNCGTPAKKRGKIGFFGPIILIIVVGLIIAQLGVVLEKKPELNERSVKQKIAADSNNERKAREIEGHYQTLLALCRENNFDQAAKKLELLKGRGEADYKDLPEIDKKIQIHLLEQRIEKIHASKVYENLKGYQRLLSLDPENENYQKKVALYRSKGEKIKQDRAKARAQRKRKEKDVELAPQSAAVTLSEAPF